MLAFAVAAGLIGWLNQELGFSDTDPANEALRNIGGKRLTYKPTMQA